MTRARVARLVLIVGVLLFGASQAALSALGVPLLDTILLGLLLVALPAFSIAQVPMVQHEPIERLPAYWGSILSLWLLGTLCWLVGTRDGGVEAIGVAAIRPGSFVLWTALLTGATLAVVLVFRSAAAWTRAGDSPLLRQLLPTTGKERGVFVLLSIAAGVGEEIAFRGYAIYALAPFTGLVGAATVSSVAFGVVHAYQGLLGVARTGIVGAVFAWGFLESGSLLPAIAAHALFDVLAGVVLGERLLSPRGDGGVSEGHAHHQPEPPWT